MKKVLTVLLVSLLILVGCGNSAKAYEFETQTILDKIEAKDSFVLYISSKDCSGCKQFAPTFEEAFNDFSDVFYSIEYTSAMASDKELFETLQSDHLGEVTVTPTIFVIKDGVVVDKRTGGLKYSELETFVERFELNK